VLQLLSTYADIGKAFTVCLCVCTDTDFSAEDKASGFTFCSAVRRRLRQGIVETSETSHWTNRPARGPRPPGCKRYRGDAADVAWRRAGKNCPASDSSTLKSFVVPGFAA